MPMTAARARSAKKSFSKGVWRGGYTQRTLACAARAADGCGRVTGVGNHRAGTSAGARPRNLSAMAAPLPFTLLFTIRVFKLIEFIANRNTRLERALFQGFCRFAGPVQRGAWSGWSVCEGREHEFLHKEIQLSPNSRTRCGRRATLPPRRREGLEDGASADWGDGLLDGAADGLGPVAGLTWPSRWLRREVLQQPR